MVAQAVDRGASVVDERGELVVFSSPAGFPFCVVGHHDESRRPRPVAWPGGQRSLLDQLSIDIPASAFERECAFWTALTGWDVRVGSRPEFIERPPGLPLRLLLQRLDDPADQHCGGHPDFACSDVPAEQHRHVALGAALVRSMANWTTMADPTGLHYCIARRHPDTGILVEKTGAN